MKLKAPLSPREKQQGVLLCLLCLLPLGVATFIERQNAPLARYTDAVPLGGSGFVRLREQGHAAGSESSWNIHVTGLRPPIQAHSEAPQGWKVEFVEELPTWNGSRSIGVRVSVPRHTPGIVGADALAGLLHTQEGAQLLYYVGAFEVAPDTTWNTPPV